MRVLIIILLCVFGCNEIIAQNNKLRADAGVAMGAVIPIGLHKFRSGLSNQPWQFAGRGSYATLDCSSGFGNGWKGGLTFSFGSEKLFGDKISDYFKSKLDTVNFFVTPGEQQDGQYAISMMMAHLANDIEFGKLLITPKLAIGFTSFNLQFHSSYSMKEKGTNYMKDTYFEGTDFPGLDFTVCPSINMGYMLPFKEDRIVFYTTAAFVAQRGTIGIDSYTKDIHGNTDYNTIWTRGLVSYMMFGIGCNYYIIPDNTVSNNSDRTRERRSKKYHAEEER